MPYTIFISMLQRVGLFGISSAKSLWNFARARPWFVSTFGLSTLAVNRVNSWFDQFCDSITGQTGNTCTFQLRMIGSVILITIFIVCLVSNYVRK